MSTVLPDGDPMPGTRADLLVHRRSRAVELRSSLFAWRRLGVALGWMTVGVVAAPLLALGVDADRPGWARVLLVLVGLLALALAVRGVVRHARGSAAIRAELRAWQVADRTAEARRLPTGEVEPELLTYYDARDRPDFEEVARGISLAGLARIYDQPIGRLLLVTFVAVVGLVVALGAVAAEGPGSTVSLLVGGAALLVPSAVWLGSVVVDAARTQFVSNVSGLERELYRSRRSLLTGSPQSATPTLPGWARPVAGVVFVVLLLLVVLRIASASALALILTGGIVVVAAVLVAVPLVRRRALHVVPLLADGGSVLEAPARRVRLRQEGDELVIEDPTGGAAPVSVPGSRVLRVVPAQLGYLFAPPAVGLVTAEEPVVLAGSGVRDHAVVRWLQDRPASSPYAG